MSENVTNAKNPFETERIGKLIARFAIPCVISLVVNALYNIVDQIFIGRGVGYLGNGATNVVFPVMVISIGFALLIGDGGAAYLSLNLGKKQYEEAGKGVGNAIFMSMIIGLLILVLGLLFLPVIINVFGSTDKIRQYALDYGYIIVIGLPFMMVSTALNSMIRADGSPKYAMVSMILGAVINTVLDPLFIFVFHWGVKGAATATIIGQIVSCIFSLCYIKKFKSIQLTRKDLTPNADSCKKVLSLGISSFITQISIVAVIAVTNNMLTKYGAMSKYGAEIPLTAMGIVMKVNQILISVMVGIATGSQPIVGYNYGAGNYQRVRKSYFYALAAAEVVAIIAFIVFQTCPMYIVSLFGSEEGLYNEFAVKCFRIFLMFCIINSIQIVSGIFFQAIGKPLKSAAVSLSRQVVFLVPASIILPIFLGVEGVLWAGPVADGLAFLLAGTLILLELKSMKRLAKTRE